MPKDIRNLVEDFQEENLELSNNHEDRFLDKLNEAFPEKRKSYSWLYKVASIVVLLGVGLTFYVTQPESNGEKVEAKEEISLGDISPEMKKIENYYLTAINYEIASLNITSENKALLDEYFEKISKLDVDYKRLNQKLKKEGITKETINSLITNLQLRLQLLIQLKDQINDLQPKENSNENRII
ncbi:hypothetical protein [uncultured Tenacibaculum sp.]|uniref:hypothetical protein n=1 Tax=uncultured Tenacibaculum sp. TaxID=174713 RepID=UPI0026185320|nr:hypothetical protein [uncultured Tenacibaculum sp.]